MAAQGIGVFSSGEPRCGHTGAPWLGVHASRWPDCPIARALVRCDSAGCEGGKVEKNEGVQLTRGSQTSEKEGKKMGEVPTGLRLDLS
jgi:hypothetical protein